MAELDSLIARNAPQLVESPFINRAVLLHALAEVESSHGEHQLAARHEPAYCYNGFYFKSPAGEDLRRLSSAFGCLAHCSYSSWQLLFISAYEEGFRGDPTELRNDAVTLPFVVRYINRRILNRYPRITVPGFADAWNSGSPEDTNVPAAYIERLKEAYDKWSTALK